MAVDGQRHAPITLPPSPHPKETRCPLYMRLCGPRAGRDGCGKSRPNRLRSPDRPARSKSLHRQSRRDPHIHHRYILNPTKKTHYKCSQKPGKTCSVLTLTCRRTHEVTSSLQSLTGAMYPMIGLSSIAYPRAYKNTNLL